VDLHCFSLDAVLARCATSVTDALKQLLLILCFVSDFFFRLLEGLFATRQVGKLRTIFPGQQSLNGENLNFRERAVMRTFERVRTVGSDPRRHCEAERGLAFAASAW
jgi:hypothetical protein